MKTYRFTREQFIPASVEECWDFFSAPRNLSLITPPSMNFKVLTPVNGQRIFQGMEIKYRVTPLFGYTVGWTTVITGVKAPYLFTDTQKAGPYRKWEHTHYFLEKPGGVLMIDEVEYQMPYGWLGQLAHWLLVKRKLNAIFTYRKKAIEMRFVNEVLPEKRVNVNSGSLQHA